jgi:GNAT superfamily N-acetyltransferase
LFIRLADRRDLPRLIEIERAAGEQFRSIGMDAIADDDPGSVDQLLTFAVDGRAWVATDDRDEAVAYLLIAQVDDAAHIEQVSVDPGFARRGIGRALIDEAAAWALRRGLSRLTLTTFADVPWNRSYYERLGFRVVDAAAEGPDLRLIREREHERGLDAWPRVSMGRDLGLDSRP